MQRMKLLTQTVAQQLDVELMAPGGGGFVLEQLMELAGLGCAEAIYKVYGPCRALVCCGPGNNGGDGLVAARHLALWGAAPTIFYPKPTSKPVFDGLVKQNRAMGTPFLEATTLTEDDLARHDIVVDAIFGFSFAIGSGIRSPFDAVLKFLREQTRLPVVSIDIPSGWDVEKGDVLGVGLRPEMLISLTAPKLCAQYFQGRHHFLSGRFISPAIDAKYELHLPPYPGTSQSLDITHVLHGSL